MMKKIIRLEAENFQSHALTVLDLSSGLNVIVGPSDQGKSALIRSLCWLIYNEPRGAEFIRRGATVCRVKAVLDSGEIIVRERSSSKNRYIYYSADGEECIFEGFGSTVPLEIARVLQMPKIVLDTDKSISLNLSSQLESPFLLEESGTARAKMIGRLTGVHIVDSALRQTIKDTSQLIQEEKKADRDLEEIKQKLTEYEELKDLEKSLAESEKLLQAGEKKIIQYRALQRLAGQLREVKAAEEENKRQKELFQVLPEAESLLEKIAALLGEKNELLELNKKMQDWKREYSRLKTVWGCLKMTGAAGELLAEIEAKLICLDKLKKLRVKLHDLEEKNAGLRSEVQKIQQRTEKAVAEYSKVLQGLGQCPLCFTPIDESKVKKIIAGLDKRS